MRQYRELASSLSRPLPLTIAALAAAGILVGNSKLPVLSKKLPARTPVSSTSSVGSASEKAALRQSGFGKLPLSFEPNVGQSDKDVRFVSRGPGYALFLTADEAVMMLQSSQLTSKHQRPTAEQETPAVVRMKVVGADLASAVQGKQLQSSFSNYMIGNDPAKWHSKVPNYGQVKYTGVYPGVDLVYYGNQRQLEYDFVVQPGADPSKIQLAFEGTDKIRLDKGDLVLSVRGREIRQHKPVVYQEVAGKRIAISSGYELMAASNQVRFSVANYDRSRALVIDPTISYASYLGSTGDDLAFGVALDPIATGVIYVTGDTTSLLFPKTTTRGTGSGPLDAYVAKIDTTKTGSASLVYSTYFGGSGTDIGNGVRVDGSSVYLVGATNSTDFPTASPVQATLGGSFDAFICKLDSATGATFTYSTYFGGPGTEFDFSLALNGGSAYAVGQSDSPNLPVSSSVTFPSMAANRGATDAFVTRLKPNGSLGFATYFGGNDEDHGYGITVDANNNIYVVGDTKSTNLPVFSAIPGSFTPGTSSSLALGTSDGFAVKVSQTLDASGNTTALSYIYSTYLGGTGADTAFDVSTESNGSGALSGNAYIVGTTTSSNFPVTTGAFQTTLSGGTDTFVTKLGASGGAVTYSTLVGGAGEDLGQAIWVNNLGQAYFAGNTSSSNLPTVRSQQTVPQAAFGGGTADAFIGKLSADGTTALYLTYYGGALSDAAAGIVADNNGRAFVAGSTASTNLPGVANGYQTANQGGNSDAYVLALTEPIVQATTVSPASLTFNVASGSGTAPNQPITLTGAAGTTYIALTTVQANLPTTLITVTPATGSIGANPVISVGINSAAAAGLSPGTYSGNVQITTSQNEVLNVPVTIAVSSPTSPTLFTTTPNPLYSNSVAYTVNTATTTNTVDTQSIAVTLTSSAGPVAYTATVATTGPGGATPGPAFVTVSPAAGSTTGTPGVTTLTITTNSTGLAAGTYNAVVTISAPGYTAITYRVSLTVESLPTAARGTAPLAKAGLFGSRPQFGTANTVLFALDKNGDITCCSGDKLATGVGQLNDTPIVGDWSGDGVKKIGTYRSATGQFFLDVNNNGSIETGVAIPDKILTLAPVTGDVPLVGDWTGTGVDRVGIFRPGATQGNGGVFYLDVNGDGTFTGRAFLGGAGDVPVVGDWNGNGRSKIGIFRASVNGSFFLVDYDGDGLYRPNGTTVDPGAFLLGQPGDIPVVGDWNGSGTSKVGLFRPSAGLFLLDYNGNYTFDGAGADRVLFLSNSTAADQPLVGNWVPSYGGPSSVFGRSRVAVYRPNAGTFFIDVNGDGSFVGRAYLGDANSPDVGLAGNF